MGNGDTRSADLNRGLSVTVITTWAKPVDENQLVNLCTNFVGLFVLRWNIRLVHLRHLLTILPVHDLLHDVIDALGGVPLAAHSRNVTGQVLQPSQFNKKQFI